MEASSINQSSSICEAPVLRKQELTAYLEKTQNIHLKI